MARGQYRKILVFKLLSLSIGVLAALLLLEVGLRLLVDNTRTVTYTIQRLSPHFSVELDDQSPLYYDYHGIRVVNSGTEVAIRRPDGDTVRFPFRQTENSFRVVAVGDSVTELWSLPGYVNYTDFLRSSLEKRLGGKAIDVIPLGVGGYNTWQEMHLYQRDFQKLHTDVLILQYCANDADVMTLRKRPDDQAVPSNEWPEYVIMGTRYGIPEKKRFCIGPFSPRLCQLLSPAKHSHNLHGYQQIPGNNEQRTALLWFRDMARAHQIPFFVAIFPLFDDEYSQAESTYIKSLLKELDIECLDLFPDLKQHGSLATMAHDLYHPNDKGHACVAASIVHYLSTKDLLP